MWAPPNPVTILALSTWTYASWAMIAHHTCHGGYNRVDAGKFNSRGFAIGSTIQRGKDWLDWMLPEAWNVEHNRLHHYRLNEDGDPDLVQRNVESFLGDQHVPTFARYGIVAFFMVFWKWAYYAPNTFKELKLAAWVKEGKPIPEGFKPEQPVTAVSFLYPRDPSEKALPQIVNPTEFYTKVLAPFFLTRFILLPAPLLAIPGIGPTLFGHAVVNLMGAEILTNIHGFTTIVTNHCGDDMYTFDDAVKPKTPSFYVRQIVGSVNYDCGTDVIDFSHGFLNYQIEHHVWPDLSMLAYQKGAPQLKAICEKYGVPYVQESVFTRLRKTVDIMVGKTTMRTFPTQYEPKKDKAVGALSWKSTNGAIDE
jgi:fatty acid desaturase